jgi:hypothetical protein
MRLGSYEVEVRNGFVVSARDEQGLRWAARADSRPTTSRLFTHLLVMAAVASPAAFTAASAHPAPPAGRSQARVDLRAAQLVAENDRTVLRMQLPAAAPTPSPNPSPSVPAAPPRPFADRPAVAGGGGHFSFGWCTWYVSTKRYVPWMGNAIEWFRNAAAMGFPEGQAPRVGAIMVTRESGWGHVAYVESVDANGRGWTVSEMNYRGFGVVSTRHISTGQVPLVGFIY